MIETTFLTLLINQLKKYFADNSLGGGIRSLEDIEKALKSGAEKLQ